MLNLFKHSLAFVAILGLSACTTADMTTKDEGAKTQKPGAAISFSAKSPKNLGVNENGVVKIKITDGYDTGTLRLTATTGNGLRFVTETSTKEFPMSGRKSHEWDLDVMAAKKGVYYVNIFAEVNRAGVRTEYRTHAVRVQVGNLTDAELKEATPNNGALSSDGTIVVMDAEEEIK